MELRKLHLELLELHEEQDSLNKWLVEGMKKRVRPDELMAQYRTRAEEILSRYRCPLLEKEAIRKNMAERALFEALLENHFKKEVRHDKDS